MAETEELALEEAKKSFSMQRNRNEGMMRFPVNVKETMEVIENADGAVKTARSDDW